MEVKLGPRPLQTYSGSTEITDQWFDGVKPHDEISIDLLCTRLGIQEVTAALRSKRLRWYWHVNRSSSCIKSVTNMEVPCSKARGRLRKTWSDCVMADMYACSLGGIDPQNRTAWRSGIRSISRLLPTPATGINRSSWKIKSGSSQVKLFEKWYRCYLQLILYMQFFRHTEAHPGQETMSRHC